MPNLQPIQKLAIMVQSLDPLCVGMRRKTALVKYLSENEPYFNNENSIQYEIFKLYIRNFILPPPHITSVLLSTRFQLLLNEEQTRFGGKFVLDVYPKEDEGEHFNEKYIRTIQENVGVIANARKKDRRGILQDNILNRICDCVYNVGEVSWFDPFIKPYKMSVKWDSASYTITGFKATKLACQAAKRVFKNEFYKTYKREEN